MRVAHIVPSMNVGGVEMAIYRTSAALNKEFEYNVYCVKSQGNIVAGQLKLRDYIKALVRFQHKPDVVVTSLWWSHPIGFISTFFGVRWVVFLHSSGFASFPDWLFTRLAVLIAKHFFYDSGKTAKTLLGKKSESAHFIPCFTIDHRIPPKFRVETDVDVIWAGRNSPEKRLDLIADIASRVLSIRPSTRVSFYVVGSQFAEFDVLRSKYSNCVSLIYNSAPDAALHAFQNSKIALCLSDYEGFSMSTAEAAFSGNLIAARDVGDLHSYLPRVETVWLESLDEVGLNDFAQKLCRLLDDRASLSDRRESTMEFTRKKLSSFSYVPAFVGAVHDVNEMEYE